MIRTHHIFILLFIVSLNLAHGQVANHEASDPQMTLKASGIQVIRLLQPSGGPSGAAPASKSPRTKQGASTNTNSNQVGRLSRQESLKRLQDQLNQINVEENNLDAVNKPLQFGSLPSRSEQSQNIVNPNELQNQNAQSSKLQDQGTSSQTNTASTSSGTQQVSQFQPTVNVPAHPPAPPKILVTEIDQTTVGKGFKVDNGRSFQRIKVGSLLKKYLFIDFKLGKQAEWQNVNIVITKESQSVLLANCTFQGQNDACYISKDHLIENQVLFVAIKCEDDCNYAIKPRWSDLQILQFGQELVFVFGQDKTQIFQVNLDKNEQNFQQIRVHLTTRTTNQPFSNAKMYVKFGNKDPTQESYDVKSLNLWEDGEAIFLTKKILKEKSFRILLVGQSQTTYRLNCQKIDQSIHKIQNYGHIYEYMDSNSEKVYYANTSGKFNFTEYSFKFSILSGQAQILYYSDQKMTQKLKVEPYQYMKDSQYVIPLTQFQEIKNGIYVKVSTKSRTAMYTLKYVARQNNVPIQLSQHVYGFIPFLPSNKVRYAFFNYKQWIQTTQAKSDIKFTVNLIHVIGKIVPEFRLCTTQIDRCTNPQIADEHSTKIQVKRTNIVSQKQTIEFSIADKSFKQINGVQKQANVIVKFDQRDVSNNETFELVALEFINKKKVLYLRQNRPLEQSLYESEERHYKYTNSDSNVVEIRVSVNVIEGKVDISGASLDTNVKPNVQRESNTLIFTNDLDKPIVVIVSAKQKTLYGIHMQIVHKDNPYQNANLYTIGQDLIYNVKIKPLTYSIFEVIPMYHQFFFNYESSQSVIACVLNQTLNQCIDESKESINAPKLSIKQTITNVSLSNRKARIKITNPFADSIAAVSVIFHSRVLDNHCQQKKIGHIYSQHVSDKQCVDYIIDETHADTLELYVSKRDFLSLTYTVYLCENSIQRSMSQKIIKITPATVRQVCTTDRHKLTIVWDVKSEKDIPNKVKVDFVAQYEGSSLLLPQGVSYTVLQPARPNFIKYFRYNLINQFAVRVILRQTRGFLYGYGKLIQNENQGKTTISNVDFTYSTQIGVDYTLQPTMLISQSEIKSKNLKEAVLLIAVYADNQDNTKVIDFDIEAIQKYEVLTQNNALQGFLQVNSIAYYSYEATSPTATTLFVTVSDHNTLCANIYLAYNENVGPKSFVDSALNRDFLPIHHEAGSKKYFIAIQATKVCDYSLEVFSIETSISYLQRGRQRTIRILKDTARYFVFESHNQAFKIFTMLKFGQVKYYLHRAQSEIEKRSFTTQQLDYKNFEYSSQEVNTIMIDEKSKIFCNDCKYFLAVYAQQNTEGTIVLASPINVITLPRDKYFSDFIHTKGSNTILSYKRIQKTNLKITVHRGQISLIAQYFNQRVNNIFKAKSQHQTMTLDFKYQVQKNQTKSVSTNYPSRTFKVPINIFITSNSDKTSYTIRASRSEDANKINLGENNYQFHDIAAGEPNHISLADDTITCLKGQLRDINQTILITSNNKEKNQLGNILFQSRLKDKQAETKVSYIKNMIRLQLNPIVEKDQKNQSKSNFFWFDANYQVCMKLKAPEYNENQALYDQSKLTTQKVNKQQNNGTNSTNTTTESEDADEDVNSFNVIVTQVNSVNILASDSDALVRNNATYIIHSDGLFILDVLECKGSAKLAYGKNLHDINQKKLLNLEAHSVSEQMHAIKINTNQNTLYVKINAQLSVLRWLPLDYQTDQGTGYLRFSAGNLRYASEFKKIKVEYQELQIVKQTKSTVQSQQYFLVLADNEQKLQRASKCQDYQNGVLQMSLMKKTNPSTIGSQQYHGFYVDKQTLQKSFPTATNIYMNIVAKFVLKLSEQAQKKAKFLSPSTDDDEHYRFIYNKQQIPLSLYQQSQLQSIPYHYLFLSVISIAGLFLLLTYLFTRKIVPMIARLKNSNLVQEEGVQDRQDDLEVPASSDRNQRVVQPVIETDQNMNK